MNSSPYPFPYGRGGGLERRLVHELRAVVVLPHLSAPPPTRAQPRTRGGGSLVLPDLCAGALYARF